MKSIRLNKELRNTIINRIMTAWDLANPNDKELQNQDTLITDILVVGAVNNLLKTKYPKLVELAKDETILPYLANPTRWIYIRTPSGSQFSVHSNKIEKQLLAPVPYGFTTGAILDYSRDDLPRWAKNLVKNYKEKLKGIKEHNKLVNTHNKERELYEEEISNIIFNVNTTKQLIEVWPEVEKFLPLTAVNPSTTTLPAVSVAKLNAALKA